MNVASTFNLPPIAIDFSVLVGMAGTRFVTNLLDNNILKKSNVMALSAEPTANLQLMDASPIDILRMAAAQKPENEPS